MARCSVRYETLTGDLANEYSAPALQGAHGAPEDSLRLVARALPPETLHAVLGELWHNCVCLSTRLDGKPAANPWQISALAAYTCRCK